MKSGFDFEFQGLDELEAALLDLDAAIAKRYAVAAGRKAMQPVKDDILRDIGIDTGLAKSRIKMKTSVKRSKSKLKKDQAMEVTVGYREASSKRLEKLGEDSRFMAVREQEFGNSRQQADPFLRPALANNAQKVVSTFAADLGGKISRFKSRQARKAARLKR